MEDEEGPLDEETLALTILNINILIEKVKYMYPKKFYTLIST